MATPKTQHAAVRRKLIPAFTSAGVLLIGAIAMTGWIFNVAALQSVVPGLVNIKANTALCFMALALSLWLLQRENPSSQITWTVRLCSGAAMLCGALTLAEYIFNINLGIDQLLFLDSNNPVATTYRGRMSPISALNFLLLGAALIWLDTRAAVAQVLTAIAGFFVAVSVIGYGFDFSVFYSARSFTALAFLTVVSFILLCIGILLARPRSGFMPFVLANPVSIGFTLALATLFIVGAAAFNNTRRLMETNRWVVHTHEAIAKLNTLFSSIQDVESGTRGYAMTGLPQFLEPYEAARKANDERLPELEHFFSDNPAQQERARKLKGLFTQKLNWMQESIRVRGEQGRDKAIERIAAGQGKKLMDDIRVLVNEMIDVENKLLVTRVQDEEFNFRRAILTLTLASVLGLILLVTVFLALRRQILVRRRAEKALHAALVIEETHRERLNTTIMAVSSGLLVTDLAGRIVLINHVAEKLLDLYDKGAVGKTIDEAIADPGLRERIRASLARRETGAKFDFKSPAFSPSIPIILCARTTVIQGRDGKDTGAVTVIEDVTHEREIDRMKTEFLSTAAHELRTPLTSIRGFSEILLTRKMSEENQRRFLETINNQSVNLGNIINDLLDLARIESGRGLELRRAATDLTLMARELTDMFAQRGGAHRIEAVLANDPIRANCDRDKIRQVFQNLLSNATKYSPEGGRIEVKVERGEHVAVCSVSDEGMGMSPDQLARIFEKFYRANATNSAIEGTGLGMSIVKAIVEQHGGTIRVSSELGKGTRVTFTVPLFYEAAPTVKAPRGSDSDTTLQASGARHIFVLEDDPGASSMLEFFLKEAGYRVTLMLQGAGFVERVAREQPDAICLDIFLPDADGLELCKALKRDPRTKAIPIIFVSVRESEKELGMSLGAVAYLTKPFENKELLAAVKEALAQRQVQPK